jgi:aspartyl-tRNA(Asn)/glutamyl-tRNA(Gln) amidotransferase subunit B
MINTNACDYINVLGKAADGSWLRNEAISNNIAKQILPQMLENGADAKEIVEKQGLSVISDEGAIAELVKKVVESNPAQVQAFKNGKTNLMGFFVGQIMKETKGRANPKLINELLQKALNE